MVFQFLYQLIEVFKAYFGNEFDEEALRDNFVLVYELFDGLFGSSFCGDFCVVFSVCLHG
jgi:hypothetical protein